MIALTLTAVLFLNTSVYGAELSDVKQLRSPLLSWSKERFVEAYKRLTGVKEESGTEYRNAKGTDQVGSMGNASLSRMFSMGAFSLLVIPPLFIFSQNLSAAPHSPAPISPVGVEAGIAAQSEQEDAKAHNDRGISYFQSRKFSEAISEFTKVIELDPKDALAYFWRGRSYATLGQYSQAISDLTKSIELDPKNTFVYLWRGRSYRALGQYSQTISDYTKIIELRPKFAMSYPRRGIEYYDLGQYPQAIADFTKAIELDPKNALAYFWRGRSYAALGQYSQAISDFTRAIELDPENSATYNDAIQKALALLLGPKGATKQTFPETEKVIGVLENNSVRTAN